jgi:hypothetical protein
MTTLRKASSFTLIGQALLLVTLFSGCAPAADAPDAPDGKTGASGHDGQVGDGGDGGLDRLSAEVAPEATLLAVSLSCTTNAQCGSGFCVDGVCCDTACDGTCLSCAMTGKVGTCSPVLDAQDDTCGGESTCDARGQCHSELGKACSAAGDCASGNCVDGVCCASSACGTCQSCAVPGSVGACAPVAKFTDDPDSDCAGANTCNGHGACQLKNGSACQGASACVSQQCADGVCCDESCTGTCYGCNQPGSEGTCKPIDGAQDHSAATACEGATICTTASGTTPACKIKDGEACTSNDQCLGGSCLTSYRDADGDKYGSTMVRRCERAPQRGYVLASGDCCDLDAYAHPGQTYKVSKTLCGNYDWDCNGSVERDPTTRADAPPGCGCFRAGTLGDICVFCR